MSDFVGAACRMIAAVDPGAHGRRLLRQIGRPWAEAGHLAPSLLAPGGGPLELTFCSDTRELRYTAEPALPDAPPDAKWRAACALVSFDPAAGNPLVAALRCTNGQRFGCWVGVRGGRAHKVYQEVAPPRAGAVLVRMRAEGLAVNGMRPLMIGIVANGPLEYYGRVTGPLHDLFSAAGLVRRLPAVRALLTFLAGRSPVDDLHLGVSYRGRTITLFAKSRQLFRGDMDARRRLLEAARQIGHDFGAYRHATRALQPPLADGDVHGMVGIMADRDALRCSIGVRPFFP